jgi:hypothetical protein
LVQLFDSNFLKATLGQRRRNFKSAAPAPDRRDVDSVGLAPVLYVRGQIAGVRFRYNARISESSSKSPSSLGKSADRHACANNRLGAPISRAKSLDSGSFSRLFVSVPEGRLADFAWGILVCPL